MAKSSDRLARLNRIFPQLLAEQEGIRHSAADALFREKIDLRDFEIVPVDPDERARVTSIEERFKKIDKYEGVDVLRAKVEKLKSERNATNRTIRDQKKTIRELKLELKALRTEFAAAKKKHREPVLDGAQAKEPMLDGSQSNAAE